MATPTSAYLARKEIPLADLQAACGSRVFVKHTTIKLFGENEEPVGDHAGPMIFRQLVNAAGEAQGYERILDEKIQRYPDKKAGDKYLTSGASTSGFTPIGFQIDELPRLSGVVVVCAGLADGYRIHEATGFPVACGVGEQSLGKLARAVETAGNFMGERVEAVVAADNDNAGKAAALRARRRWVVPKSAKDWSDVYQAEGVAGVITQFSNWEPAVSEEMLEDALAALGVGRQANGASKAPAHEIRLEDDPSALGGQRVSVVIDEPSPVPSLERYVSLGDALGMVTTDGGRHHFAATDGEGLAVVMNMLNAGLEDAMAGTAPDAARDAVNHIMALVESGQLDEAEIFAGSPIIGQLDRSEPHGVCRLALSCDYAPALVSSFKRAGGRWDKENKHWRFEVVSKEAMQQLMRSLCHDCEGRLLMMAPTKESAAGGKPYLVAHEGREDTLSALYQADLDRAMAQAPANSPAPATKPSPSAAPADKALQVSLSERQGWRMLDVSIPYDLRDKKDVVRDLGATFDGQSKSWRLPMSRAALDALEALPTAWDQTPGLAALRAEVDRHGFGVIQPLEDSYVRLTSPYDPELIDRLKEDLPPIARRFNKDAKAWEVHLATPAITNKLKAIASAFDLRVVNAAGAAQGRGDGWEDIAQRAGANDNDPARPAVGASTMTAPQPRQASTVRAPGC